MKTENYFLKKKKKKVLFTIFQKKKSKHISQIISWETTENPLRINSYGQIQD